MQRATPGTYDVEAAFQAVPDTEVAELLDGELFVRSRPRPLHARAASRLGGALDSWRDGEDGSLRWLFLGEPALHLGPDRVVPDLAGWHSSDLPP